MRRPLFPVYRDLIALCASLTSYEKELLAFRYLDEKTLIDISGYYQKSKGTVSPQLARAVDGERCSETRRIRLQGRTVVASLAKGMSGTWTMPSLYHSTPTIDLPLTMPRESRARNSSLRLLGVFTYFLHSSTEGLDESRLKWREKWNGKWSA